MASTITDRASGVGSGGTPNGEDATLSVKVPCRVATTANITLSGTQTIDGVSVIADDRVLVKNQTTSSENGIYVASATGWSRSTDAADDGDLLKGSMVRVNEGSTNTGLWYCTASDPIDIGTDAITWARAEAMEVATYDPNGLGGDVFQFQMFWVAAGGTADALTATFSPALNTLTNGMVVSVRAASANATTTPTFKLGTATAKTIVKEGNNALLAGDIRGAGHEIILRYNSSNDVWELINPTSGVGTVTASRILGRNSGGGDGAVEQLTGTQTTALLDAMVGDSGSGGTKGLVPAPSANDGDTNKEKVLSAAGTFIRPAWREIGEYALSNETSPYAITDIDGFDIVRGYIHFETDTNSQHAMQFGTSGAWLTGASDYSWVWRGVGVNSADSTGGSEGGDYLAATISLCDSGDIVDADWPFACEFVVQNLRGSNEKLLIANVTYRRQSDARFMGARVVGNIFSSSALTRLRFNFSTTTTNSGNIFLEGRILG